MKFTIEYNKALGANPQANFANFQSSCNTVGNFIQTPAAFGTGGSLRLGASAGNPGYFTYAEMTTIMQTLQTTYPTLFSRFLVGYSSAGTAIYGIKISDNVGTDEVEPEVLYTGLMHPREAIEAPASYFICSIWPKTMR